MSRIEAHKHKIEKLNIAHVNRDDLQKTKGTNAALKSKEGQLQEALAKKLIEHRDHQSNFTKLYKEKEIRELQIEESRFCD